MHQRSHAFSGALALTAILFSSSFACRPSRSSESGGGASGSNASNSSGGSGGGSSSDKGGNSSGGSSAGGSVSAGGSSSGGGGGGPAGGSSSGGSVSAGGSSPPGGAGGGSSPPGSTSVTSGSCTAGPEKDPTMPGYPDDKTYQDKAAAAMQNMTTAEKAAQMRGTDPGPSADNRNWTDIFRQPDDTKNGINGFTHRDGPRGVNLDAPINSTKVAHAKSTVFPVSMARGAAWDIDLEYRIGQAIGDEMVAAKQSVMLGPTINLLRHPLWGRAQETYGEDPFQLGRLGTAHVAGVQQYVPACPKHFLANNIENLRDSKNASMDDQTLHEIYGRHFEMVVQDGGAACIMSAYNLVNNKKCTQNSAILNDLLRKDFGFKGFVLTDWWAMPGGNGGSPNASYMAEAIKAGNDIELPWNWHYSTIESAVGSSITQSDVDTAVKRILAQKYRFKVDKGTGLKDSTSSTSDGSVSNSDHEKIALEAAEKSMVLLKNEKNTLPIPNTVKKIAVLGLSQEYFAATETSPGINNKADDINGGVIDFAKGVRVGDVGSSRVNFDKSKAKGPFDGIKAAAGSATVVAGSKADDAKDADFIVVVAGLTPYDEGEEYNKSGDRTNLLLDGKDNGRNNSGTQEKLIKDAAGLGKPMVVVLEGGSVIDISGWESSVPAIVMAWYPGMEGGLAMGELLFGQKNFSGKLPISWPKSVKDLPDFNPGTTATMDYYVGYRYFDKEKKEPRFPFGYGLSYTKYEYSNLVLPCADATTSAVVKVSVDVSNKGSVDGEEVVLLFASYPDTKARRPIKELKGFARVAVPAGGKKTVTIPLRVSDLKYWSADKKWVVETGAVKVQVGPSSADLPLSGTFTVK